MKYVITSVGISVWWSAFVGAVAFENNDITKGIGAFIAALIFLILLNILQKYNSLKSK